MENKMYKDKLPEIQAIIDEIEKQIQDAECVFRGEPEYYKQVSCGVFREYNIEDVHTFPPESPSGIPGVIIDTLGLKRPMSIQISKEDIQNKQNEILRDLQDHINEKDKPDQLNMAAILQHIGDGTHLLDFTKDYRIAIFFACRKEFDKDGRIIFLKTDNEKYKFHDMSEKKELQLVEGRAKAQKSVLVDSPDFIIEEADQHYVCRISEKIKIDLLEYLKTQGISAKNMFPDYLGYISLKESHRQAYEKFRNGLDQEILENYDQAQKFYDQAINLKYDFAEAYKHRGRIWLEKDDLEKAEKDLTRSLYFHPDDWDTYYNTWYKKIEPGYTRRFRSVVYLRQGRLEEALHDCNKAIELNSRDEERFYNRGRIYEKMGELDKAITNFNEGLKIKRDDPKGLYLRGKTYLKKGEIDDAIDDFSKFIEINDNEPEILKRPEFSLMRKVRYDVSEILKLRGKSYAKKSKFDEAKIDLNRVLELYPNESEALKLLTIIQQKRSERNED